MARKYKLTWKASGRRWRKRYKGKDYYFPAQAGETKESSYPRCLEEWNAQRAELDVARYETSPSNYTWQCLLAMYKESRKRAQENGIRSTYAMMDELVQLTEASIARQRNFPGAIVSAQQNRCRRGC